MFYRSAVFSGVIFLAACGAADVSSADSIKPAAERADAAVAYEPMTPFAKLAGRAWRGEGTGPDGKPIVDVAYYEMILAGRAFQSTHKIENATYGGRTIFFYDEGAKKYIYHYFTTAGFHTVGEISPTETGFTAVEQVVGHPEFIEVRSEMIIDRDDDGPILRVESSHVRKGGEVSAGDAITYREVDPDGILLFDEADALFGKRTDVKDAHDKYKMKTDARE